MPPLPRRFYSRDAAAVARDLLGRVLVGGRGRTVRRARITETEAYVGPHDMASHSRMGRTRRNASMFGPPGHAYVYLVYGVHHCLNVVTGDHDGQAVLLRAAEPLDGWAADLRGPGRLARGFGITLADDGVDLLRGPLRVLNGPPPAEIRVGPRVGVHYAGPWAGAGLRFSEAGSRHVSRPRPPDAPAAGRPSKVRPGPPL